MTIINDELSLQIQTLRDAGLGYKKISNQLNLNLSTVKKHCKRKFELEGLPPKIKRNKCSINARKPLIIKKFVIANPRATLLDIKYGCELNENVSTISRYLKKYGMESKKAKSRIVISDKNKKKRLDFCKEMLKKSDEFIANICWSDETMVKSHKNGDLVLFRVPPGADWFTPSNESVGKVMFWGCMTRHAIGPLVEVVGTNNATNYIATLKDYLLPEFQVSEYPLVFQQDNATLHKTAAVNEFFRENAIPILDWPPQSPDLSPIENMWNIMKMKMKALRPRPRTSKELKLACLKLWTEISDDNRKTLIDGFKDRLKRCIKAKGDLIKI